MPRKHRPRTTTLYLPPPDQVDPAPAPPSSSSSSSPSATAPPSLDVLLTAQQIAHSRGQVFDIESFLSPSQREEYIALLSEGDSPADPEAEGEGEGTSVSEEDGSESGEGRPTKRTRASSSLAQVYWRQRIDRLAMRRSATPAGRGVTPRSIKPEPEAASPATPTHYLRDHRQKPQDVVLPADRPEIQASASYWNHLLIQARAHRGPQWDYSTQMLQYDQHTPSYYSHGLPPPPTPPRPEPKKLAKANGDPSTSTPANATNPSPSASGSAVKPNGEAKGKGRDKPSPAHNSTPLAPALALPQPSTPARPPTARSQQQPSPASSGAGGTPRFPPDAIPPSPQSQNPALAAAHSQQQGQINPQTQVGSQSNLPPHLRMQAAAQANVQAQALALGQSGGFNLNPAMMHLQQQGRPGISPMALMGGMGGMQMGQMGTPQGAGGPGGPGAQGVGQGGGGPTLAGGWGEQGFHQ